MIIGKSILLGGLLFTALALLPACQSGSETPDQQIRLLPPSPRSPGPPNLSAPAEENSALEAPESVTEPRLRRRPAAAAPESLPHPATDEEDIAEASASPSVLPVSILAEPPRWNYQKYFLVLFDGI